MRELRGQNAAIADERQRHEQEIRDVKCTVESLWKAIDGQQKSQQRERRNVAEVEKVIYRMTSDLTNLGLEIRRDRSGFGEITQANEQLRAGVTGLKQRIGSLEREDRELWDAHYVVKREIGRVLNWCPKLYEEVANVELEVATLKEEMTARKLKAESLARGRRQRSPCTGPIWGMVAMLVIVVVSLGLAFANEMIQRYFQSAVADHDWEIS
jgi:chromosome segregation ATPase